jgi:hypothetical protein
VSVKDNEAHAGVKFAIISSRNSSHDMTDFTAGQSAAEVDRALRGCVSAFDRLRQNLALWFTDALERELYRELGHPSMEVYAREGLGFSTGRTRQFLRLSRELRRMPTLRAAVTEGQLGWTKAQEVARMLTPANEEEWVEKAVRLPREELRREMAQAKARARRGPAARTDPPTTIGLKLDGLQLARFDALVARAKSTGAVAARSDRSEVVLAGLAALTDSPRDVRRHAPPVTVVVQQCPDCEAAFVVTGRGPKRLTRDIIAAMMCDHQMRQPDGSNRSAIPIAIRNKVLDRDQYRCTVQGCSNHMFLDVHHLVPRWAGGTNDLDNLITMCTGCHQHVHKHPD